jgi:hypothetical protein
MTMRIGIETGGISLIAKLKENETTSLIVAALPFEGQANRWGQEIYFAIPVEVAEAADARQDMQVGELGYWPPGKAFCIFFGPTPASDSKTPRAASNVNPFGMIEGDATTLSSVSTGEMIKLSILEP